MVKESPWAPAVKKCGGDGNMGILLNRLEYFHDKTSNRDEDGEPITIRTYAELAQEFGWTPRQAKHVVTKLKNAGLIRVAYGPHPTIKKVLRCCHICLTNRTKSVSLNEQNSSDPLYFKENEEVKEDQAVPTVGDILGNQKKDFGKSKIRTSGALYDLWRDCMSEAYPNDLHASWGKGMRSFANSLIAKYPWEPLVEGLRRVILDWEGFRMWLSEHTEVKCKADRPDLLFLLKHGDHMIRFGKESNTAIDKFEKLSEEM